eukprot:14918257-Alexandrium_andersonii.AAC.1
MEEALEGWAARAPEAGPNRRGVAKPLRPTRSRNRTLLASASHYGPWGTTTRWAFILRAHLLLHLPSSTRQ